MGQAGAGNPAARSNRRHAEAARSLARHAELPAPSLEHSHPGVPQRHSQIRPSRTGRRRTLPYAGLRHPAVGAFASLRNTATPMAVVLVEDQKTGHRTVIVTRTQTGAVERRQQPSTAAAAPSPKSPNGCHGIDRAPRSTSSPPASWRSSASSPRASRTGRSGAGSTSARRPWAFTWRASSRRPACTAGCRRARSCTAQARQTDRDTDSVSIRPRSLRRIRARVGPMVPTGIPVLRAISA